MRENASTGGNESFSNRAFPFYYDAKSSGVCQVVLFEAACKIELAQLHSNKIPYNFLQCIQITENYTIKNN